MRSGGRFRWMWFATVAHGLTVECVSYFLPDVDNFWHAQSMVTLLGGRLPLHIIILCKLKHMSQGKYWNGSWYPTVFYPIWLGIRPHFLVHQMGNNLLLARYAIGNTMVKFRSEVNKCWMCWTISSWLHTIEFRLHSIKCIANDFSWSGFFLQIPLIPEINLQLHWKIIINFCLHITQPKKYSYTPLFVFFNYLDSYLTYMFGISLKTI